MTAKPWTVRLVAIGTGVTVAYATDLPRFWTRRGAAAHCTKVNNRTRIATALWVPVRTRRSPW